MRLSRLGSPEALGEVPSSEWAGRTIGRSAWYLPVVGLHCFSVAGTSDSMEDEQ